MLPLTVCVMIILIGVFDLSSIDCIYLMFFGIVLVHYNILYYDKHTTLMY